MMPSTRIAFFISLGVAQAVVFNGTSFIEEYVCERDGRISGVCTEHGDCKLPATEQGDCGVQDSNLFCCSSGESSDSQTGMRSQERCAEYSGIGRVGRCPPFPPWSGNNVVAPGEHPYIVALGYRREGDKKVEWKCHGGLISVRYVLTAARCVKSRASIGAPQVARLGSLHQDSEDGIEVRIVKHIPHPLYDPNKYYDNIGLLKLERDMYISPTVRPACLHTEFNIPATRGVVAGWGVTETWTASSVLRKVDLPLVPHSVCHQMYNLVAKRELNNGIDNMTMVCAGGLKRGKDTCSGDLGAPLVMKLSKPYCTYSIIGVTSFGTSPCGRMNRAGVYTRVSNYIPWIESVVWPY